LSPRKADLAGPRAGFTLLEVLVALAVMATMLGSIAALAGSNARASRSLDGRAALVATARAVEAGIPPRAGLEVGSLDGEIDGHRWQAQVRPMPDVKLAQYAPWVPRRVSLRVRSPSGAVMTLETLRLVRNGAR
jgi:general secretion pathway protein I